MVCSQSETDPQFCIVLRSENSDHEIAGCCWLYPLELSIRGSWVHMSVDNLVGQLLVLVCELTIFVGNLPLCYGEIKLGG